MWCDCIDVWKWLGVNAISERIPQEVFKSHSESVDSY